MANEIEYDGAFEKAISSHYLILLDQYSKRPFFYKNALKFSRLMSSFILLSEYFSNSKPLLSDVKESCVSRGYCSKNSVESLFLLYRALGFLEVRIDSDDARYRTFAPSVEAFYEIRTILNAVIEPLVLMFPNARGVEELRGMCNVEFLSIYFIFFSKLLKSKLTIDVLLPECYWVLDRDAGHLLMLAIYSDALVSESEGVRFRKSSYLSLAEKLSVSKSHVIRFVNAGADKGYFKIHSKTQLELLPSFISLVRRFMAFTFAIGVCSTLFIKFDIKKLL
ncbi:hypothetical protein ACQKMW_21190 [Pseudomonas sivasensis]|uniref:hypothetical protein n=1 Tax=Pseudomonas sivasensis TaxID=1880678 RepID=UPI003CFD6F44